MLFVTPSPGATFDADALAGFVEAGVIEPPARPRAIVTIGEMPMTPVGKIYKPRLREIAAEQAAREALAAALPGESFAIEARHGDSGLIVTAHVPPTATEAARAALGRFPVRFEIEAG